MRKNGIWGSILIFSLFLFAAGDVLAAEYKDGEVLVKFSGGALDADIKAALEQVNGEVIKKYGIVNNLMRVKLPAGTAVPEAVKALLKNRAVLYAEPNYIRYPDAIPDDPSFGSLWGMNNTGQTGGTPDADIDAPEAWDIATGSDQVVVGVIDTGIDLEHEDLAANLWTNPGEIAGNNIDDDGNGYVDDIHGWDFYSNDSNPDDTNTCKHGTHVAGTIGAVGNNGTGVAGVNWNVKLMALRFLGGILCTGSDGDSIEAIQYAARNGARILNASWGGGGYSRSVEDAIRNSGLLFVAAAGNGGLDGIGDNNDANPFYPSSYNLADLVSAAATDHNDLRASFSNYGNASVDIAAPGVNVLSTVPNNQYASFSGTSMATPHVSGAAALILSRDLSQENWELIWKLLQGTDYLGVPVLTKGRLNAYESLLLPSPQKTRSEEGRLSYAGTWRNYSNPSLSGGNLKASNQANATATYTFQGTGVLWISGKSNNLGKADIYIDGVFKQTVDLYSPTRLYQQPVYSNLALTSGPHTIKILVKRQKNSGSTNYYVPVDAIDIVQ